MTLLLNQLRRTWKLGLLATSALFGFQMLIVRIFVSVSTDPNRFMMTRSMPQWAQNFFGLDRLQLTSLEGFLAISYQHPFVIVGILCVPIAIASALLAGEVESKTIVLLLSRPISRMGLVISTALICWFWPAVMAGAAVLGTVVGARVFHVAALPKPELMAHLALNLYLLTAAVGGISVLFSAWSSERSDAVGWSVTVVLIMYVWNFLAQVWADLAASGVYSIFNYYAPARILLRGSTLLWDYQVLGATALGTVLLAMVVYRFRDFNV